jgi:hypothetical protein
MPLEKPCVAVIDAASRVWSRRLDARFHAQLPLVRRPSISSSLPLSFAAKTLISLTTNVL